MIGDWLGLFRWFGGVCAANGSRLAVKSVIAAKNPLSGGVFPWRRGRMEPERSAWEPLAVASAE